MKSIVFNGTGVALVTPFRKQQDTVDFSSLESLIERMVQANVSYIVALGTTSEAATMTFKEQQALQEFIVDTVNGRVPIVLGLGGNDTRAVAERIHETNFDGISGILSVTPYYNKPQQKGLVQHFKSVADMSPVPLILYNVPGRTGCNLAAESVLQLAEECPNVVGVKEASGNLAQAMEIIRNKPARLQVISGDDALTLPLMALGATGVISVIANALPFDMVSMVNLALKDNVRKAAQLHYKMLPLIHAIFEEGNPAGIKALLEIQGSIANSLRLPLCKVSKQLYNKLSLLYNAYATTEN